MKRFVYQFIIFMIIPITLCYFFVWFYEKPQRESLHSGTSIKQQKWNSVKNHSNKYDVIILGSSRGYCAYNPNIIDSITRLKSYNMCTGSQHIIESLYMFEEILKDQKPKYLVYEIFLPSFRTNPDFYHVFSNAKYMSNDMIMNEFIGNKILDVFFPIVKYKSYLKHGKRIGESANNDYEKNRSWISGHRPSSKKIDSISIKNFRPISSFSNIKTLSKNTIERYLSV